MMLSTVARRTSVRAASTISRTVMTGTQSPASRVGNGTNNQTLWLALGMTAMAASATFFATSNEKTQMLSAVQSNSGLMLGPTKEKSTGILFPALCNGMHLAGAGVRIKYGLIKVYAVGTYLDPVAMMAVKNQPAEKLQEALLDPAYPRVIRIVMARGLSIDKYNQAIVEALEPKMQGQDLNKLEEFKKLNPAIDLVKGAEIEMTIRGDTLLYKNAVGGVGMLQSAAFCKALCEIYYGDSPVSPTHKEAVIAGIPELFKK